MEEDRERGRGASAERSATGCALHKLLLVLLPTAAITCALVLSLSRALESCGRYHRYRHSYRRPALGMPRKSPSGTRTSSSPTDIPPAPPSLSLADVGYVVASVLRVT